MRLRQLIALLLISIGADAFTTVCDCGRFGRCVEDACECDFMHGTLPEEGASECEYLRINGTRAVEIMNTQWSMAFGKHWAFIERSDIRDTFIFLTAMWASFVVAMVAMVRSLHDRCDICVLSHVGIVFLWTCALLVVPELMGNDLRKGRVADGNGMPLFYTDQ